MDRTSIFAIFTMRTWHSIAVAALLIASLLIGWGIYTGQRIRDERRRENLDTCRAQLGQIYKDLRAYADHHQARFPPRLSDLVSDGYENQDIFICPNSYTDNYIQLGTPSTQMANLMNGPNRASYKYLGNGLSEGSPPNAILVIEAPENHAPDGGHVVYVDGSIVFLSEQALGKALESFTEPPERSATSQPGMN